jgi:hypothetical protein
LRVGYYVDPLRVRRGFGVVVVVPVPPLVRRGLGVTLWRVLLSLLTAERRDIEVGLGRSHRLVAAVVDEVSAEDLVVVVADEYIMAVPLVHAEIGVEAVRDGVPRHLPTHSCLQALDVLLWRARGVRERGVAGVQMGQVGYLIGAQRAAGGPRKIDTSSEMPTTIALRCAYVRKHGVAPHTGHVSNLRCPTGIMIEPKNP